MTTAEKESIILGSGTLYMAVYDSVAGIPADETLEAAGNDIGYIKGGAELTYTPTEYEVTNDFAHVIKRFITKEEASFKSGILTWAMENLARLCPGVLTTDSEAHEKILKIGGASAMTNYVLRFVHVKADALKLRVTIVATASSGFTLAFKPDTETTVDAQFKAISQTDGTLIEIREAIPAA